ncbi:bi-domain-containing oxidoreductase [Liberiplasma polymorphum]|uniref:bi-domain-containing oxidoreductase n=1 Tax=Liberiplasma polymorphum TaxID=3374570 RepID=UPI003772D0F2
MKQLFLNIKSGDVELIETPKPTAKENYVIVETLYSVVSAGTERSLASFGNKNLLQKAIERPDQLKKVLEKISTDGLLTTIEAAFNKLEEPMPLGYTGVGRIIECGKNTSEYFVGDIVAMVGQAYHSEINRVNKNLITKVSNDEKVIKQAAFAALGGIALQGIHQSDVKPGETVAIIGMGLLGHITARILNAYGCDVIGLDINNKELLDTKLKAFILTTDKNLIDSVNSLTKHRGVDKVIITASTSSNDPVDIAAAIARDKAIICMIGVTKMELDRRPFYEKELTFTMARSYGPGRYDLNYEEKGIDYPIGHVRFTEGRNIEEFIRLIENNKINLTDLITHIYDFKESSDAYNLITNNPNNEKYIGILFNYLESESKNDDKIILNKKPILNPDNISIGIIGGGAFARSTLLKNMKKSKKFNFRSIATTGGISSAQTTKMYKFDYATNNYSDLLADDSIDLIVISTAHNSHAAFVIEALNNNKNVYCEKPLCLNMEELNQIEKAYSLSKGELFVGLNRKHSPFIRQIKKDISTSSSNIYNYQCNAGHIPKDNWNQDENIGGGRIIGEAIHFVDTLQFLEGNDITNIITTYAKNDNGSKDNAVMTISFSNGSVGTIIYTSVGSKKFPKEKLVVHSTGKTFEMTNYLKLVKYSTISKNKSKLRQNKGFLEEYDFIYNVLVGNQKNIYINSTFNNHRQLMMSLENSIELTPNEK